MAENINIAQWQYQNKNIDSNLDDTSKYTRGDRTILYSRLTPSSTSTDAQKQFTAIGMIQGFTHSEQKQLQMIFELGSAAPIIIPGLTTGQISINRVLISGPDFMNVIYGKAAETDLTNFYKSLRDINKPFDLMIAKFKVEDPANATANVASEALSSVVFERCQIQARSESISPGGVITVENLSIMYKQIASAKFTPTKTQ